MQRTALRDLVLIEADAPPEKSESGLLIYEEWQTLPPWGTVLAVGPRVAEVKVGERVMFERYGSVILDKVGSERLCKENQIFLKEVSDA